MVKKEYIIKAFSGMKMYEFELRLKDQLIKFKLLPIKHDLLTVNKLLLNISPDMVSEVEELIMEIAEKSGVKVE